MLCNKGGKNIMNDNEKKEVVRDEDMYWAGFTTMLVIVILFVMIVASGGVPL
jgi:hypothetical protein